MLLAERPKTFSSTKEKFYSQYIPNEKSVASLLVATHTSSHAAHSMYKIVSRRNSAAELDEVLGNHDCYT